MAASDSLNSLDSILATARRDFEAELKAMKDQLLASQIESTMAKDGLAAARASELQAHRVMARLLAQFGAVAKIFEDAKAVAEDVARALEGEAAQLVEAGGVAGSELEQKIAHGINALIGKTSQ